MWDWDELIVTLSSRKIERARPTTSNPGPMLAEEQGTRILNFDMLFDCLRRRQCRILQVCLVFVVVVDFQQKTLLIDRHRLAVK